MTESVTFTLPWPVSVNQYWRGVRMGERVAIYPSPDAKKYKQAVADAVWNQLGTRNPITARVSVDITVVEPTRHRRDIDNLLKAPFDGLSECGFWADDSQVDAITIRRSGRIEKPGWLMVTVTELDDPGKLF